MRAQRISFLFLVALLAVAPLAAGGGETVTSKYAVSLHGSARADLTDALTLLYAPGTSTTLHATAGTLTVHRYTLTFDTCTSPLQGCIPGPSAGRPQYKEDTFTYTEATLELTRNERDMSAFLTTNAADAVARPLSGSGWSTHSVTGPSLIGYPEHNTSGPRLDAYWPSYPTPEVNTTDAEFGQVDTTSSLANITYGGWFQVAPFGATFRVDGLNASTNQHATETFTSSGRNAVFASPFTTTAPQTYYVFELDGDAHGVLTSTGKLASYKPVMSIAEEGGGVAWKPALPDGSAGDLQERTGDLRLDVTRVRGDLGQITFTLAPLHAAPQPPNDGPLDHPAVVGTAAAVTLAATAVALAYWWPQFKYALTALALPMYTRIAKDEVLSHGTRDYIYDLIRESPGIHAHEISSRANIGWGTAVYHLKLLESHRMVVGKRDGRYKRFFVNDGRLSSKKEAYGILRNETASQVAQYILNNPGCNQKDLCAALGLQPSLANWHTGKLEEAQLVKKIKEGRMVRYFAGPAWSEMQLPGFAGAAVAVAGSGATVAPHAAPDLIGEEN